jgi:hydroxymethylbilane synthase
MEYFPFDKILPAPGQGALALECREEDRDIIEILQKINHQETYIAVMTERKILQYLGAGCDLPLGAYAVVEKDKITVYACWGDESGNHLVKEKQTGKVTNHQQIAKEISQSLKHQLTQINV